MIRLPFRRPGRDATIRALYGMIVAQARSPSFYLGYGVPDTVPGRIEMIMLHLAMVLRRLRQDPAGGRRSQQELFDLFCQDMDDNFREMGVGDLTVPKEMKRVAEAFYGRAKAYDGALDADDEGALAAALARNVFAQPAGEDARRLAAYMVGMQRTLSEAPAAAVLRSEFAFPDPEGSAAPEPAKSAD